MNATEREKLKTLLLAHEGLRLKPYMDSVGKYTIGVGRNLDDVGITRDEAMMLLENDIDEVERALDRSCPWWKTLSENRQLVLMDMCFNLGIVRLLLFRKFLGHLQVGKYEDAASEMMASKWASQVGMRAVELSQTIRTDTA